MRAVRPHRAPQFQGPSILPNPIWRLLRPIQAFQQTGAHPPPLRSLLMGRPISTFAISFYNAKKGVEGRFERRILFDARRRQKEAATLTCGISWAGPLRVSRAGFFFVRCSGAARFCFVHSAEFLLFFFLWVSSFVFCLDFSLLCFCGFFSLTGLVSPLVFVSNFSFFSDILFFGLFFRFFVYFFSFSSLFCVLYKELTRVFTKMFVIHLRKCFLYTKIMFIVLFINYSMCISKLFNVYPKNVHCVFIYCSSYITKCSVCI